MNKRVIGREYEQRAADFLKNQGYQILERNFQCKVGEIDLIAKSEEYLCFIEVKYRSSSQSGFPAEAIHYKKIQKIYRTAQYYMLMHQIPQDYPCRFDAVLILDNEISLIKNAFDISN